MSANCVKLQKREKALRGDVERSHWEYTCEQVADLVSPQNKGFTGHVTPGTNRRNKLLDNTGEQSNSLLSSSLHGMATNPASKWYGISLTDERLTTEPSVKKYLSDVEDIMWSRMYEPGTNLVTALNEIYHDLGAFGTACLYTTWEDGEEDSGSGHLRFEARQLSEHVFAESNRGIINENHRRFNWTVDKCVQEWGIDGVSDQVKEKYNAGKLEERICIIHSVFPRTKRAFENGGMQARENLPFASVYFEKDTKHMLEESGYHENPFAVPRWSKRPSEVYGRGPGMAALPDLNMLQAMSLSMIKVSQKVADPPVWIRDEGFVEPQRLIPGGITPVRGNPRDSVMLMPTSSGLPITLEIMEGLRNRIRSTFFTDQLQIVNDANMTATEVMQRTTERMRLLGPILGRLESELLGPLIERVYGILERQGLLPEAPEEIVGKSFTVKYVSPIAQAQRMVEVDTWHQFVAANGVYLQNPETAGGFYKMFPVDRVARYFADLMNLDPDLGATDEQLAQASQQEQMMQMAQMAGPFNQAASGIKQLSDAGVQGGEAVQGAANGAQGVNDIMSNLDPSQLQNIANGLNLNQALQ